VRALTRDARKAPSRIELQRTVDRIELNELDDELRIGHAMLSSPENARSAEPLRERIASTRVAPSRSVPPLNAA
jgi:hypothetical protein